MTPMTDQPRFTYRPIPGYVDLFPPSEESLVRSLFENGHADNTITVWLKDTPTLGHSSSLPLVVVHCGHCNRDTSADVNSGHFCCRWAGEMYQRYFERARD